MKTEELLADLMWIESLGYDTVIQYCHPTHEIDGGHVIHITKPSGQSIVHSKGTTKLGAIQSGVEKFKKQHKQ